MSGPEKVEQSPMPLLRWRVGDVTITKIVETETLFNIPELFPMATVGEALALPWLQPHFLTPEGQGTVSMHALVIEALGRRIIVDTCVGNGRDRAGWPHFTNLQTRFLEDLEAAGFARENFDTVLCTHMHSDHVGWNTMLQDGEWVPTFPRARYLLNRTEFEYWQAGLPPREDAFDQVQRLAFADAIQPVLEAGLVDLVEGPHRVCEEVTLIPTPGHSPGHVSVQIRSRGEEALITGDIAHHPSQLAHTEWGLPYADFDYAQGIDTRRLVFGEVADRKVLVIGTHWAGVTAGWVKRDGNAFCLDCRETPVLRCT